MRAPERASRRLCRNDLHPGQPPWGSRDPRLAVNQFYAFAVPYVWLANAQQREAGLHLMISDVQRIPAASADPSAKNYHWNDLTMGLLGALDAGADSVVLVDSVGNVVEGPGFNVFCVSHGALVTPSEGMLEGISRRTVIEMARSLGLETQPRALPADQLLALMCWPDSAVAEARRPLAFTRKPLKLASAVANNGCKQKCLDFRVWDQRK